MISLKDIEQKITERAKYLEDLRNATIAEARKTGTLFVVVEMLRSMTNLRRQNAANWKQAEDSFHLYFCSGYDQAIEDLWQDLERLDKESKEK